jgi:hypothetical protein
MIHIKEGLECTKNGFYGIEKNLGEIKQNTIGQWVRSEGRMPDHWLSHVSFSMQLSLCVYIGQDKHYVISENICNDTSEKLLAEAEPIREKINQEYNRILEEYEGES